MKILHVTSDNKPGGIQKAFKSYVAAVAPLSGFETFYFTPNYFYTNNEGGNANYIKLSWLRKTLIRRNLLFSINYFHNQLFDISFVHIGVQRWIFSFTILLRTIFRFEQCSV